MLSVRSISPAQASLRFGTESEIDYSKIPDRRIRQWMQNPANLGPFHPRTEAAIARAVAQYGLSEETLRIQIAAFKTVSSAQAKRTLIYQTFKKWGIDPEIELKKPFLSPAVIVLGALAGLAYTFLQKGKDN